MEFVYQIDNHLPKDVCEQIIEKYKNDPRKEKAKVGKTEESVVDEDIRKSHTLHISDLNEWTDLDKYLHKNLQDGLGMYRKYLDKIVPKNVIDSIFRNIKQDSGYIIQEMKKDDFYNWHVDDFTDKHTPRRLVTAIWYLNTLDEDDGGQTEFWMKNKIRPTQGTLLFFPSCWSYIHRGGVVKNDTTKYTCITWLID
jgi:hypothetical protein